MQSRGFGQDITNTNQDRLQANVNKPCKPMVQPGTCPTVPPALPRQGEPCVQLNKLQGATSVPVPLQMRRHPMPDAVIRSEIVMLDGSGAAEDVNLDAFYSVNECDHAAGVGEYVQGIFSLLLKDEKKHLPAANYMDGQREINSKMRAILMDWLVEVHSKYRLRPETLYLTASTIDRYLSKVPVLRKRLQLVGVVAMFIAAKFEEINPPGVNDYEYITDNAYTKEEILNMECQMLTTLNFQIVVPTVAHFMERLQQINCCDTQHKELVNCLAELALLEIHMIRLTPSFLASAAILLSNELLGKPHWPVVLEQHTHQTEEKLRPCAEELRGLWENAPRNLLQAVWKKYQTRVPSGWSPTQS